MSRLREVRVETVTRLFGPVRALAGVSLGLSAGEVVALMGPNGAGKSTLLSILALQLRPTAGSVTFDGSPASASDPERRRRVGLLSHQPLLYPELTGRENLALFAHLAGDPDPRGRVGVLLERFDLGPFADRPVRDLSRGQLQRVSLARALAGDPDLLLLDEPAAGLDVAAVGRISEALATHRERGGLAAVVTHEVELAARIATRVIVMLGGRVVANEAAPRDASAVSALYHRAVEEVP